MKPPKKAPCISCPYRKDVPPGVWHESEYSKLPMFDLPLIEQPPRIFGCHQNNGHLCGGWTATHDMEQSLGIRVALSAGHLDPDDMDEILDYESPVPLFETGAEAAAHGMSEIDNPGERARQVMDKMLKKGKIQ